MKRNKGPNAEARVLTDVRRLTPFFYYWRYHEEGESDDDTTHRGLLVNNPKRFNPQMIEYELHRLSVRYQAMTISYCRDMWGNTYKHASLISSNEPLRFLDDNVTVLISAAKAHAEQNANAKHIYARAMVLLPDVKGKGSVLSVLRRHRNALSLDDKELEELSTIYDEEATLYDIPRLPQSNTDREIREYLDITARQGVPQ